MIQIHTHTHTYTHTHTQGAMAEFLEWQAKPSTAALYKSAFDATDEFILNANDAFLEEDLPIRVDSLTTVLVL